MYKYVSLLIEMTYIEPIFGLVGWNELYGLYISELTECLIF